MAVDMLLGIDVGSVRIGVAMARGDVRIAQPLMVVPAGADAISELKKIIEDQQITQVIVGWPRGMQGQETEQTRNVEQFVEQLRQQVNVPIELQDEALTSQKAESELRARGKPFEKGEVDSLAATFILEDYIASTEQR